MKIYYIQALTVLFLVSCQPQKEVRTPYKAPEMPKLLVGIVVDQMRADYIYRYYDKLGENGFKRLLKEGFEVKNATYNYVPTYTGPGHASIYTGATPSEHGIIANNWYSYEQGKEIYCAYDSLNNTIGSSSKKGKYSPGSILSSTITDELHLFTNKESKVYGVSIKDRGAIFPAGRTADGAFWYDPEEGKMISSDYYYESPPDWLEAFNAQNMPNEYLSNIWNTLLPIEEYTASTEDNTPYEGVFKGKEAPVFPYNLSELRKENGNFGLLPSTPYGNSLVTDFSIELINSEALGTDKVTDFLAVSYSSTDYIGHRFGPNSIEVQDTYLRLDKEIERFLNYLDDKVGNGNYMIFLTSDHGVVRVPAYLKDQKISAGDAITKELMVELGVFVAQKFGSPELVENVSNNNIYLNRKLISEKGMDIHKIRAELLDAVLNHKLVRAAYSYDELSKSPYGTDTKGLIRNGFHPDRSGDIIFAYKPAYLPRSSGRATGTSHGTGLNYDTHVPLIWYGWGVKQGYTVKRYHITDIAPTISMKLNIPLPNTSTGQPIEELFD